MEARRTGPPGSPGNQTQDAAMEFSHIPVLPGPVIEYLAPGPGGVYVDGTVGGAGHSALILESSGPDGRLVGLDRDTEALEAAGKRLAEAGYEGRFTLVHGNFREMDSILSDLGVAGVDGVLLDVGVSSWQLNSPERGFSFMSDAPLDMRMDRTGGVTAAELVNTLTARELARVFRRYGEERFSDRIASRVVRRREKAPVRTTGELAEIVLDAVPKKFHGGRIHPATRVFQALRIEVNDEINSLAEGLDAAMRVLNKGGRLVVISFHSLEDRVVKRRFRELATGCVCPPRAPACVCGRTPEARLLTRRAVSPGADEVEKNPRARSAKLRAVEKLG